MRYSIFVLFFCISFLSFSQYKPDKENGLFYKISVSASLSINKDYTLTTDDSESFFKPSAVFLNNTIGYVFDSKSAIGLNFEYDRHYNQNLNFFPIYLSFQYNVFTFDDNVFLRGGYGVLTKFSKNFETGNMFKTGIGYQTFDENYRNSWMFGLDFTQKQFGFRKKERLSTISLFVEFQFF